MYKVAHALPIHNTLETNSKSVSVHVDYNRKKNILTHKVIRTHADKLECHVWQIFSSLCLSEVLSGRENNFSIFFPCYSVSVCKYKVLFIQEC